MKPGIKQQLQSAQSVEEARTIMRRAASFERPQPRTVRKWHRIVKEKFGVI